MNLVAPILEYDPNPQAVINPSTWFSPIDIPRVAVLTWMRDVVDSLMAEGRLTERHRFVAESAVHPVWHLETDDGPVTLVLAPVGSPMAAGLLEVLIALGCTRFVAIGSSGGLTETHLPGTVVVPSAAVRDEGVSYHYLPPSRTVGFDPKTQRTLRSSLTTAGFPTADGLLWTTDALFRETPAKVLARVEEGCIAVDMEAAALAAVAQFRGVPLGQAVYIADTLHSDTWDATHLLKPDKPFRRRLLFTVINAALAKDPDPGPAESEPSVS